MTAVGINGLGRIGRLLARRMYERDDARHALELVMSNEVADGETVVHLLKYDSTHGRFSYPVALDKGGLRIADRFIGLSNETPYGVLSFLELSKKHGLAPMVSIQNAYNLLNRRYEYGLSEITDYIGISLLAYSPLAFGHLTGKYLKKDNIEGSRLSLFPEFGVRYDKPNVRLAVREYNKLAQDLGISLTKLSLAFCYSRQFVSSTIIGATNVHQLNENIEALNFKITKEIEGEIFKIYQKYTDPAP